MTKQYIELQNLDELGYAQNEAYKSLRTNLTFCGSDIKKVLLTSSVPNEGKSSVSFQLAKALAADSNKVLFIDADLRKSVLIGRLGAIRNDKKEIKGLSHYLSGQVEVEEVVYGTNVSGLDIVFSGPVVPSPTELLGNDYMNRLLNSYCTEYDYVIIDAPPLGSVVDALILTRYCDGSILVIQNNHISRRLAQNIKKQLEQGGCRLLGAVLNKVDMEKNSYYNGYYKGYYKEYYNEYQE